MIKTVLEARELLEDFDDNNDKNIDDRIFEAADGDVSVYNSDRRDWMRESEENLTLVEEAIDEFGWEGVGKSLDGAIGYAQLRANERLLREAWEEMKEESTKN